MRLDVHVRRPADNVESELMVGVDDVQVLPVLTLHPELLSERSSKMGLETVLYRYERYTCRRRMNSGVQVHLQQAFYFPLQKFDIKNSAFQHVSHVQQRVVTAKRGSGTAGQGRAA